MKTPNYEQEPMLRPIKGGWSAHATGWAVHGATQEEAVRKYWERMALYKEIDVRGDGGVYISVHTVRPGSE